MDVFQDKLTDCLLGDLVLAGHVIKIADDVYFSAKSMRAFTDIFTTIMRHCAEADLRLKLGKVRLNIYCADTLGLN